jgi:hypothetical protein
MYNNREKWVLRVFLTFVFAYGAVSSQKPSVLQQTLPFLFGNSNNVATASLPSNSGTQALPSVPDTESGDEPPQSIRGGCPNHRA